MPRQDEWHRQGGVGVLLCRDLVLELGVALQELFGQVGAGLLAGTAPNRKPAMKLTTMEMTVYSTAGILPADDRNPDDGAQWSENPKWESLTPT